MVFERKYQVRILAKQLINRRYCTILIQPKINPWFLTGFTDAEGSFIISIYRDEKSKLKFRVTPSFSIHIHKKDILLLEGIKNTLGIGKVRKNSETTALFRVDNIKELQVIIDHFKKYPLVSAKYSDFLLFEQCYNLIKQKQHLTQAGFEQILSFKYNLNEGLSEALKKGYPHIEPVDRPEFQLKCIPDPFWISGFVSGDSTFSVSIEKSRNKLGKRVRLIFGTNLHIRDKEVLLAMANYLNSLEPKIEIDKNLIAKKYIYDTETTSLFQIKNYTVIINKIIPFFNKYPILGVKSLDFEDFKKIAFLMANKEHLTPEGISRIIAIVSSMNLDRNITNYIDKKI